MLLRYPQEGGLVNNGHTFLERPSFHPELLELSTFYVRRVKVPWPVGDPRPPEIHSAQDRPDRHQWKPLLPSISRKGAALRDVTGYRDVRFNPIGQKSGNHEPKKKQLEARSDKSGVS
jgi:hypothetical protein